MVKAVMQPEPVNERVRQNVKTLRKKRGLQLEDVSNELDALGVPISVSSLSKLELGQRRVGVDDLVALAVVLGVSPNRLLLSPDADDTETALTLELALPSSDVWAWATGDKALPEWNDGIRVYRAGFAAENRPHDPKGDETPFGQVLEWEEQGVFTQLADGYKAAREAGVPHRAILGYLDMGRKVRTAIRKGLGRG